MVVVGPKTEYESRAHNDNATPEQESVPVLDRPVDLLDGRFAEAILLQLMANVCAH
jgi:hypothetical protein